MISSYFSFFLLVYSLNSQRCRWLLLRWYCSWGLHILWWLRGTRLNCGSSQWNECLNRFLGEVFRMWWNVGNSWEMWTYFSTLRYSIFRQCHSPVNWLSIGLGFPSTMTVLIWSGSPNLKLIADLYTPTILPANDTLSYGRDYAYRFNETAPIIEVRLSRNFLVFFFATNGEC